MKLLIEILGIYIFNPIPNLFERSFCKRFKFFYQILLLPTSIFYYSILFLNRRILSFFFS